MIQCDYFPSCRNRLTRVCRLMQVHLQLLNSPLRPEVQIVQLLFQAILKNYTTSSTTAKEVCAHLSPYTRCRFLLGLPPGVMSLCLPASSNSFSKALLNALGSIASAPEATIALSVRAPSSVAFLSDFLFSACGGGVVLRGGVATGGVFKVFAAFVICAWYMVEL